MKENESAAAVPTDGIVTPSLCAWARRESNSAVKEVSSASRDDVVVGDKMADVEVDAGGIGV